jgi:hypothetical protein
MVATWAEWLHQEVLEPVPHRLQVGLRGLGRGAVSSDPAPSRPRATRVAPWILMANSERRPSGEWVMASLP